MEFAEGSLPLDTSQIDQNLAATVSNSLLKSNISCVLWGNFLLNIYGVPSAVNPENVVPNIILASDPALPPSRAGRGFGGLHAISSPVYIPSIHIFTEAWIREAATAKRGSYVDFAHWMVSYIELYVDEDGLLDTSLLEPRTRTYFLGRKNSTKTIRELFLDLKSAFSAERELVPPVPLRPGE
ncbi:hypothetical protein DL98DRAFT_428080 [Cadophora sp. DSE1049]|nr:hypothetical protein DL98DRAFT_428080 [Cadophora sp. DSE1049]